mgnify:CR=1 FL=1
MLAIKKCLDGKCDHEKCRFAKTPCTHCRRSLHVAESGMFGTARAAEGLLRAGAGMPPVQYDAM